MFCAVVGFNRQVPKVRQGSGHPSHALGRGGRSAAARLGFLPMSQLLELLSDRDGNRTRLAENRPPGLGRPVIQPVRGDEDLSKRRRALSRGPFGPKRFKGYRLVTAPHVGEGSGERPDHVGVAARAAKRPRGARHGVRLGPERQLFEDVRQGLIGETQLGKASQDPTSHSSRGPGRPPSVGRRVLVQEGHERCGRRSVTDPLDFPFQIYLIHGTGDLQSESMASSRSSAARVSPGELVFSRAVLHCVA